MIRYNEELLSSFSSGDSYKTTQQYLDKINDTILGENGVVDKVRTEFYKKFKKDPVQYINILFKKILLDDDIPEQDKSSMLWILMKAVDEKHFAEAMKTLGGMCDK